jgi:elongation factor Ts
MEANVEVTAEMVKVLREKSGAGVMECKKILVETGGDIKKAEDILKERGLAVAAKKADRVTAQGIIEAYVHAGNKIGVLVEVNCETDFVARTPEFRELAHNLALQVAAMAPKYVAPENVPAGTEFKPETDCLLCQPFVKDPGMMVGGLITETIAKVKENIRVSRFIRFELGV